MMCDAGQQTASGQGELGPDQETVMVLCQVARLSDKKIPAHMAPDRLQLIRDLVGAELWRLSMARNEGQVAGC